MPTPNDAFPRIAADGQSAASRLPAPPVVLRVPRFVVSPPPPGVAPGRAAGKWPWHIAAALAVVGVAVALLVHWQAMSRPPAVPPTAPHKKTDEIQTLPTIQPPGAPYERTASSAVPHARINGVRADAGGTVPGRFRRAGGLR
jgi:hypothetical protein